MAGPWAGTQPLSWTSSEGPFYTEERLPLLQLDPSSPAVCLPSESIINSPQSRRQGSLIIPHVFTTAANVGLDGLQGLCCSAHSAHSGLQRATPHPSAVAAGLAARLGMAGGDPCPCPGPSGGLDCTRTLFRAMNPVAGQACDCTSCFKANNYFSKHS